MDEYLPDDDSFSDRVMYSRSCIHKMIQAFKSEKCLWDTSNPYYRHTETKKISQNKLLEILKQENPHETLLGTVKKMDGLRTCFRKEWHKTRKWSNYVPKLWYYKMLLFLEPEMLKTHRRRKAHAAKMIVHSNKSEEDEQDNSNSYFEQGSVEYEDINSEEPIVYTIQEPVFSKNITEIEQTSNKPPKSASKVVAYDEYDAIGINVAAKLRKLPSTTRIIAEKLINDVLYQAQLGSLQTNSTFETRP